MQDALSVNKFSPEKNKVPWLGYHVHPEIVTLGKSHLLTLLHIRGKPFETSTQRTLNSEFSVFNRCIKALGKQEGDNLSIQTWTFKKRIRLTQEYQMPAPVLQELVDVYTGPLRNGTFRQTGYAMALMLKYSDLDEGISRMTELMSVCREMLADFGISFAGLKENANGQLYSEVGSFFCSIINGVEFDVPVTDSRLGDVILDGETGFGAYDYVENRPYRGKTRYATTYDLRGYPKESTPGMWDEAIDEQYDFCLVQSFHFIDRNRAKRRFNVQKADLSSTEGESVQTLELEDAAQEVAQGEKIFGDYHSSLIVFGDTPDDAITFGARMQALMLTKESEFVRSTSTNVYSWLTLFPGYTDVIYRMPKSTDNLACGFSLHASPTGKALGNPPGDGSALMPMMTEKNSLYFFNTHSSPEGHNNTGEMLPGHKTTIAMTGAGKTTQEALEQVFFSRWDPMLFCIDYNHSLENLLRVLGTHYISVVPGHSLGIQPFQWPDSVGVRQFLTDVVKVCAGGADDAEIQVVTEGIDAVMKHSNVEARSFSLLLQYIQRLGGNSLRERLQKWCRNVDGKTGEYAWVLDAPRNLVDPTSLRRLAADCSPILTMEYARQHPEAMEVILSTLFFMKKRMQATAPGSLLINLVAECWAPLMFDSTAGAIMEILHAGRTRNEVIFMDTQVPEYLLQNERGPSVVQQTITQQWMANEKATFESYSRFAVTKKEFDVIRSWNKNSHRLLVCQDSATVILNTTISGRLKYWLPLLSSTFANVAVAQQVREALQTDDPLVWAYPFLDEMVAQQVKKELATSDSAVWYPHFEKRMRELGRQIPATLPLSKV